MTNFSETSEGKKIIHDALIDGNNELDMACFIIANSAFSQGKQAGRDEGFCEKCKQDKFCKRHEGNVYLSLNYCTECVETVRKQAEEKGRQLERDKWEKEDWGLDKLIKKACLDTIAEAQKLHKIFESHYHEDANELCEYCEELAKLKQE